MVPFCEVGRIEIGISAGSDDGIYLFRSDVCHNQKHVNLGLGRLSYWAVMLLLLLFGIVEQPLLPSFISQRSGNSISYFIDMKIFQTQKWKKYYFKIYGNSSRYYLFLVSIRTMSPLLYVVAVLRYYPSTVGARRAIQLLLRPIHLSTTEICGRSPILYGLADGGLVWR